MFRENLKKREITLRCSEQTLIEQNNKQKYKNPIDISFLIRSVVTEGAKILASQKGGIICVLPWYSNNKKHVVKPIDTDDQL